MLRELTSGLHPRLCRLCCGAGRRQHVMWYIRLIWSIYQHTSWPLYADMHTVITHSTPPTLQPGQQMMKLSCVTCLLLVGESANMYLRIKLNQLLIFDYRPTLIMMTYSFLQGKDVWGMCYYCCQTGDKFSVDLP